MVRFGEAMHHEDLDFAALQAAVRTDEVKLRGTVLGNRYAALRQGDEEAHGDDGPETDSRLRLGQTLHLACDPSAGGPSFAQTPGLRPH